MNDSALAWVAESGTRSAEVDPRSFLANRLLIEFYHAKRHPEPIRSEIMGLEFSARGNAICPGLANKILEGKVPIAIVPKELKPGYEPPSGIVHDDGALYLQRE